MVLYTVSAYMGQFKETLEIEARNQAHLRQKVEALGYRLGSIHRTEQV